MKADKTGNAGFWGRIKSRFFASGNTKSKEKKLNPEVRIDSISLQEKEKMSQAQDCKAGRERLKEIMNGSPDKKTSKICEAGLSFSKNDISAKAGIESALNTLKGSMNSPLAVLLSKAGLDAMSNAGKSYEKRLDASMPFARQIVEASDDETAKQLMGAAMKIERVTPAYAAHKAALEAASAVAQGPVNVVLAKTALNALNSGCGYTSDKVEVSKAFLSKIAGNTSDGSKKALFERALDIKDTSSAGKIMGLLLEGESKGKKEYSRDDLLSLAKQADSMRYQYTSVKNDTMDVFIQTFKDSAASDEFKSLCEGISNIFESSCRNKAADVLLDSMGNGLFSEDPTSEEIAQAGLKVHGHNYRYNSYKNIAAEPYLRSASRKSEVAAHSVLADAALGIEDSAMQKQAVDVVLNEIARPSGLKGYRLYAKIADEVINRKYQYTSNGTNAATPFIKQIIEDPNTPAAGKKLMEQALLVENYHPKNAALKAALPILARGIGNHTTMDLINAGAMLINKNFQYSSHALQALEPINQVISETASDPSIKTLAGELNQVENYQASFYSYKAGYELMRDSNGSPDTSKIGEYGLKAMHYRHSYLSNAVYSGMPFLNTIKKSAANPAERRFAGAVNFNHIKGSPNRYLCLEKMLEVLGQDDSNKRFVGAMLGEAGYRAMEAKHKSRSEAIGLGRIFLRAIEKRANSDIIKDKVSDTLVKYTKNDMTTYKNYLKTLKSVSTTTMKSRMREMEEMVGMHQDGKPQVVQGEKEIIIDGVRLGING